MKPTRMLILEGWNEFRTKILPPNVSAIQLEETRRAFYAGAIHLFYSLVNVLEPGDEPTESDLKQMDAIKKEIESYADGLMAQKRKQ